MANITILEALNRSLIATKKYVDDKVPHYNETLMFEISGETDYGSLFNNGYFNINALNLDETKSYVGKEKYDMTDIEEYTHKFVYDKEADTLTDKLSNTCIYNHKSYDGTNFIEDENSAVLTAFAVPMVITDNKNGYFKLYEVDKVELDNNCLPNDISIGNSLTVGTRIGDIGESSVVEGFENTASGSASHAEGDNTIASGYVSHAEGYYTTASDDYSHAEGQNTTASGSASHAEGSWATADGNYSHAEGDWTIAGGICSHAEGNNTKASSENQHVQGKYNIEDTENKYAHIVGNGTSDSARSNAHTLDWNGNAWYQGKLSQDGVPIEDKDLTTKKYVDGKVENMPYTIEKNIVLQIPQSSITRTSYRAEFPIFEYDSNKRYIINYNNEEHELYQYPANLSAPNGSDIKGPTLLCELNSGKEIRIRLGSTSSGADDTKLYIEVGEIATTDLVLVEYSVKTLDNKYIPKHFESLLSISLGRKKGTTIGLYSSVLGYNSKATNYHAHAEGESTTASGESSHAEGSSTVASGEYSHAEGSVAKAIGNTSHAEGYYTKASGSCSHAEGSNTEAIGMYSHVEGSETITKGRNSHAEGYSTIASGEYQHVQGKYNIEDKTNTYVHIVGNGTSDRAKSNAHTLDWNGNAWYAGKLSQDGEPIDDKDLVTKKYLENSLENKADKIISNDTYDITTDMERVFNGEVVELNMSEENYHETLSWSKHPVINNIEYILERTSGSEEETFNTFNGTVTLKDFFVVGSSKISCMSNVGFWGEYSSLIIGHRKDDNKLIIVANLKGDYTLKARFNKDEKCLNVTIRTLFMGESTEFTLSSQGLTGLASETYVNNKIAELVNSAPEALDTLNELSQALGNDPNFATTISNQIGLKANSADLATVATSGSYNDLSDKPTIPAAYTHPASHPASMITGLHTVATSGDYNDLTNRPIKVLPDNTTVADLYNLEMGIYLLTNNIEFNITDDTNMENGVVFNKFSPFTPILYRGNGMVGDLSSNIYYVFTSDGSLISAGTTDNSWAGTIATVATTGSYDDLTNKPTIPTVTNDLTNALKSNYDTAYTHSQSAHAPVNAQKNSDITKAEIEAKLTGNITSHTHSQYLTSIPSEYITEQELTSKGYATKSQINSAIEAAATTHEEVKTTVNQILGGAYIE